MCTIGSYSLIGQGNCLPCPVGYACPVPFIPPVRCREGQHTDGSAVLCQDCPSGSFCQDPRYISAYILGMYVCMYVCMHALYVHTMS